MRTPEQERKHWASLQLNPRKKPKLTSHQKLAFIPSATSEADMATWDSKTRHLRKTKSR